MKEFDCVEVNVEKEVYARHGVHKGMQGWICLEQRAKNYWLVNFPQYGEKDDIAEISILENDLTLVPSVDAHLNERLKAQFDEKSRTDISCFVI